MLNANRSGQTRGSRVHIQVNDAALYVHQWGAGDPLLLLHGFTGSGESWSEVAELLASDHRVIAPDLLGHGQSDAPTAPERYRIGRCADDLIALLDVLKLAQVDLLGYSMGGRVGLYLALTYPTRVRRLVLESASPGLNDSSARAARVAGDAALAEQIERDGVEAFIDYWENIPLFESQRALPGSVRERARAGRLRNRAAGLANCLRGLSTGAQSSLWNRLTELDIPTLLIAGALDVKFTDINRRMADALPQAQLAIFAENGHSVHLESPGLYAQTVRDFLSAGG